MNMQLCAVGPPNVVLPPSDIELMKIELEKVNKLLKGISDGKTTEETYTKLKEAVSEINDIILSLDNSNDFYKIGGFNQLPPLLACSDSDVVAATAELIADLVQNNSFCQSKILDINIMPDLVRLLAHHDLKICSKALYALSCLCRHNEDALKQLEISSFLPTLLSLLQRSDEKIRTKAAFFVSYLCLHNSFRELLYQADIVGVIVKLLNSEQDTSFEHLLSALATQISHHKQSRVQCRKKEYNLKELLHLKMSMYDSRQECVESKQYCSKILELCFLDQICK